MVMVGHILTHSKGNHRGQAWSSRHLFCAVLILGPPCGPKIKEKISAPTVGAETFRWKLGPFDGPRIRSFFLGGSEDNTRQRMSPKLGLQTGFAILSVRLQATILWSIHF